ncbi:hypothetical protein GCM10011344_41050 [Dokdonia pacifica]|uniref:Uncharacterized protein n=1 Tax=Dokdonia pacifica TaxID=1627892 RepID=A0A239AAU4_9FLAO|nr:hypothetical protein [Dokdonia pacifica]GGG35924.1 hypothetical protein GCM10011344_41050 [Dokdonia pacifica]SNR92757.1 hypothetical protein SAMN06265376_104291 [Dokdonia pacifica]
MDKDPIIHTHSYQKTRFQYVRFASPGGYHSFVQKQSQKLFIGNQQSLENIVKNAKDRIRTSSDWYGNPSPNSIRDLEEHHYFGKMELLEVIAPKIKKELTRYTDLVQESLLKRPQLSANSKGLGVFSFDRAMMGLYKIPLSKNASPLEKYTHGLKIELGKDKATTVKNTHLYFENKSASKPTLTLTVLAGANANTKGDALYYVGIAVALLTEYLESCHIAVAIDVLIGTSFGVHTLVSAIRVKRFEDPLDTNQLLVLASDPRYFRFNGFKGLIALSDYCGVNIPDTLGKIDDRITSAYMEYTANTLLFNQSYSIDRAVKEVSRILLEYTKKVKTR